MLGRIWRWIEEQSAFVVVFVVLAGALGYLVIEPRAVGPATGLVASAVLLAGVFRLALPKTRVGQLAVRGRILDSFCYLVLGGLMLAVDIRLHR